MRTSLKSATLSHLPNIDEMSSDEQPALYTLSVYSNLEWLLKDARKADLTTPRRGKVLADCKAHRERKPCHFAHLKSSGSSYLNRVELQNGCLTQ